MIEGRRSDDKGWSRFLKNWPIVVTVGGIIVAYIIKGHTWDQTVETVKAHTKEIISIQQFQAVQVERLSHFSKDQDEMRKDIKELLRRVR